MQKSRIAAPAVLVALALLIAACGNSISGGSGATGDTTGGVSDQPGVSADKITVGGVAAITNPLGGKYGDTFNGVEAYFDMVNKAGGIFGRQLDLAQKLDDNAAASRDASQVRALVEQDNVFAVIPVATTSFSGGTYLAENNIPTFGWNINPEWSKGPSLFGEKGSYLCFTCASPYLPFLAKQSGRTKVAILAYTAVQSVDCAKGQEASFDKYGGAAGVQVVFKDTSLNFGFTPGDIASDIQQLRDTGAQLVSTCIDGGGSGRLARAIHDAGLDIVQFLPNGYDSELIAEFGDVFEGSYVSTGFVPFEETDPPDLMKQFLAAMDARNQEPNENSLAGWIDADLFVTGLKAAGENFTRQSVVDEINKLTAYNAGGIVPAINWTIAHSESDPIDCTSTLQVKSSKLIPVFGEPGKPFTCFDRSDPNLDLDKPELR